MKIKFCRAAFPALSFLLGLLLSGAISNAATLSSLPSFSPGNLTVCYSNTPSAVSISLGGRSLPPNSILRVPSGSSCSSGETPLGLASYSRTVLVGPKATATASGDALLQALATIQNAPPAPSATSPYLLKLEPGRYDLGSQSLVLLPFVDLEGSGQDITTLVSSISTSSFTPNTGTLVAANNSEVRFLKVANTGTGNFNVAIYTEGLDQTSLLINLTAHAAGSGNANFGLFNKSSSPTVQNSTLVASDGTGGNRGLYNYVSSSPTIVNTTVTARVGYPGHPDDQGSQHESMNFASMAVINLISKG